MKNLGLVKTVKFKNPKYIGDPMNAIRIFNKKKADELIFLDIMASIENRILDIKLITEIGEECTMPFAVGGGIKSMKDIEQLFKAGAEKVVINSAATIDPSIINIASEHFGRQSIIVAIDVKKKLFGGYSVYSEGGRKLVNTSLKDYIKIIEDHCFAYTYSSIKVKT